MELLVVAFIAGVLTVAAPCILPLLPIIVGSSVIHGDGKKETPSLKHPLIIVSSLAISIVVFTLLLKATTVLLGVPATIWSFVAGAIVLLFGVNLLIPALWEKVMLQSGLQTKANQLLGKSQNNSGVKRDILLGASLGLVFNSCSPTYALIVAVILPASFTEGLIYLIAYSVGVAAILLLVSLFGQAAVRRLKWLSNPNGVLRKTIGVLFIIVGLAIIFNLDRSIQAYVLEKGWYDPISNIEKSIRNN